MDPRSKKRHVIPLERNYVPLYRTRRGPGQPPPWLIHGYPVCMAERKKVAKKVGSRTYYGPFDGSEKNGKRRHYTWYDSKTGKRGSVDAARFDKERSLGRKLRKDEHVDHKDNNRRNDSASNTRVMSAKDNIAKGNRERTHRRTAKKTTARKKS